MPVDTPLHKAANQGDSEAITGILDAGSVDINAEGAANRTALHRCCGGNHIACADLLLTRKANINALDKSGRSPLHWACIGGHEQAAKLLLNWKSQRCAEAPECKVNAQTKAGMTALASACESGKTSVVKVMVEYNKMVCANDAAGPAIDLAMKDGDGKTAFDLAKDSGHKELIKFLKDEGLLDGSAACRIS